MNGPIAIDEPDGELTPNWKTEGVASKTPRAPESLESSGGALVMRKIKRLVIQLTVTRNRSKSESSRLYLAGRLRLVERILPP